MTRPPPVPRRLAAEALAALLLASLQLRTRPFERLVPARARATAPATHEQARAIERVLRGWSRRLPWKPACFEQALAARRLLESRGHEAVLHYGSRRGADGLEAHVWVSSGGTPVVGHRNAGDFVELARFPAAAATDAP